MGKESAYRTVNDRIVSVSVIIPVWRNADLAAEAVASVFAQSFRPVEVILVDDASGDATTDSLFGLQKSYPEGWIKVLVMPHNGGPGEARNLGIDSARGKYLAFLDADDLWHIKKVEIQYSCMERVHDAVLCCAAVGNIRDRSDVNNGATCFKPISIFGQLFIRNVIATSSVMVVARSCKKFVSNKRHAEDFLLWSTIMLGGGRAYQTNEKLVWRRKAAFGEAGLSGQIDLMYAGALDCFDQLKSKGLIGPFSAIVGRMCVHVRYCVRRVKLLFRSGRAKRIL